MKSAAERKRDERERMRASGYTLRQSWVNYKEREKVNGRVGANVYGRLECVQIAIESGDDEKARRELLALLKFFPPRKVKK